MSATSSGELDELMGEALARHGPSAETLASEERPAQDETPTPDRGRASGVIRMLTDRAPRLELEGVLGEGGMGVVHLATQTSLDRRVAVKMLHPKRRGASTAAVLMREARITGSLEHPNIMPVYDACIDDAGEPQVVLKRIDGALWSALLEDEDRARACLDGDDPLVAHLEVLIQICRAAHFAHARGIVHRDIKPGNVIVGHFGEICLLDWGIAVEMEASARAEDGALTGTPAYMAPEMLSRNTAGISPATDVYLLGACLYEILTGEAPHDGADPKAVVRSVMRSRPSFPHDAPTELVAIARRAMAPRPADRFPSAEALRVALVRFLEHRESITLTREASRHLDELVAATTDSGSDRERHAHLLRSFGACRFGFSEALRRWDDNARAREGLTRAFAVMIEHEARAGNASTAVGLLEELAEHAPPPDELVVAVARAETRAARERERVAELERIGRMFDPNQELRARWIVTSALGLLGTVVPVLTQRVVDPYSNDYTMTFVYPVAFMALVLGTLWLKRAVVARNAYHRWVAATVLAGLVGQIAVLSAGAAMRLPIVSASAFVALVWALATGMFAATTDRRAFPMPLAYLAACFATALVAHDRREANYIAALGHLAAVVTVFVIWHPRRDGDDPPR